MCKFAYSSIVAGGLWAALATCGVVPTVAAETAAPVRSLSSPGKPGAPVQLYAEPSSNSTVVTLRALTALKALRIEVRGLNGLDSVAIAAGEAVQDIAAGGTAVWRVEYAPVSADATLAVFVYADHGGRVATRAFSITVPGSAGPALPKAAPPAVTRAIDGRRLHVLPGATQAR